MESFRSLSLRTQSLSTTFSDLESYRSTSSGSFSTIDSYGPVSLPPRTSSMPNLTADLESEISSLAESLHTVQNDNGLSLLIYSEPTASETESMHSINQHEIFFQAPSVAPTISMERNNWSAPSEWSSMPSPPLSSLSAAPPRRCRHFPFKLIRSTSKKRPSKNVVDVKDKSKRGDTLWHSNRSKGAQAQRRIAKRKKEEEGRKNKDMFEEMTRNRKRGDELEQTLVALTPSGKR